MSFRSKCKTVELGDQLNKTIELGDKPNENLPHNESASQGSSRSTAHLSIITHYYQALHRGDGIEFIVELNNHLGSQDNQSLHHILTFSS